MVISARAFHELVLKSFFRVVVRISTICACQDLHRLCFFAALMHMLESRCSDSIGQRSNRVSLLSLMGRRLLPIARLGSVCWGSSTPVIRTTLERTLRDHVVVGLPPLRPGVQPSGGTLTSVPATFFTRQPTIVRSPNLVVTGMVVRLYARPVWHWLWGDGSALWTAAPGQPHPSTQVQHQYRTPGLYLAQVQTNWSAVYTVDDLGPFTTTGDLVTQQSTLAVRVLASRVLLAPWS